MDKKKPIWIKTVLLFAILAILGGAAVITLLVLENTKTSPDLLSLWENIVLGVSCSVVASVIYAILQRAYSRNDEDSVDERLRNIETNLSRQNELYDSGIMSIRPKAHFDQEDAYWNKIISGSSRRLDLIGHSLSKWFGRRYRDIFIQKIKQIVESNNFVNIVLSSSSTDALDQMLYNVKFAYRHPEIPLSKIEKTLLEFYRLLKDQIVEEKHQYLKIYVTDLKCVTYFYIRTDIQCIISPYTYSPGERENIFLLELRPDTNHVKILEDDFDEMIDTIMPIDFHVDKNDMSEREIWPIDRHSAENKYSGSDWNREVTEKIIFRDYYGKYEVGFFEHYQDQQFKKSVIELPVSYGCPSKCSYCASANIDCFYPLTAGQMKTMFDNIYKTKDLEKTGYILLTITGMGDLSFNRKNLFEFLGMLKGYNNLHLTLSSNFWTESLLNEAVAINNFLPIRNLQYTYVSDKAEIRKELIDIFKSWEDESYFDEFIAFIKKSDKDFFRINYIVISGVNDSEDDVERLIGIVNEIKDKVVIRISKLNETGATKKNGLTTPSNEKLIEIKDKMKYAGLNCYVFYSETNDNMNCGQLITEHCPI